MKQGKSPKSALKVRNLPFFQFLKVTTPLNVVVKVYNQSILCTYVHPNLLGTRSGVLISTGSGDRLNFIASDPAKNHPLSDFSTSSGCSVDCGFAKSALF